jgi:uncharacterized membrane protein required for colicin V production
VNIVDAITNVTAFDWLAVLFLVGFFVLGWVQGTIRRLLGIASIVFSFLLAANLREPLGKFLAEHWTQWPREYSYMLAFLFIFVVASVIFAIVIQSFYKQAPLFAKWPIIDELLGGILGVVEGLVIIGAFIAIFDSFFKLPVAVGDNQLQLIKDIYGSMNDSGTAAIFRDTLLPGFVAIFGVILPSDLQSLYGS